MLFQLHTSFKISKFIFDSVTVRHISLATVVSVLILPRDVMRIQIAQMSQMNGTACVK